MTNKTTFKNFIKKNEGKLFIKIKSDFDGCIDGMRYFEDAGFKPLTKSDKKIDNNMNYKGIWLAGSSNDYFNDYNDGYFRGIECYNCCGSFIIAIKC